MKPALTVTLKFPDGETKYEKVEDVSVRTSPDPVTGSWVFIKLLPYEGDYSGGRYRSIYKKPDDVTISAEEIKNVEAS